jgi:hypothetical protein
MGNTELKMYSSAPIVIGIVGGYPKGCIDNYLLLTNLRLSPFQSLIRLLVRLQSILISEIVSKLSCFVEVWTQGIDSKV